MKKENELTFQLVEMRMIRRMCGIEVADRFTCSELKERLGIDDVITVVWQHRLSWCGHVLRKDKNDFVKTCMDYEVEAVNLEAGQRKLGVRL